MFHQSSTLVTDIFRHLLCAESQQEKAKPEKGGGDGDYSSKELREEGGMGASRKEWSLKAPKVARCRKETGQV